MDSTSAAPSSTFFGRHEFLIRRLHSLSGLVPVGAYMCVHLVTNASVIDGPQAFQTRVDQIHSLGSALPFVEWTFIFLPLIFHGAAGVAIASNAQPNTGSYPYVGNVRYTLQRATAWIALVYIFWHVFHMHGWFHLPAWLEHVARPLHGAQFDPEHATSSAGAALGSLLVQILYGIGTLACVFHLANGLWTMGITWGVWTSPAAMKRANYACAAFGIVLSLVALGALRGMSSVDLDEARRIEERMARTRQLDGGELTASPNADRETETDD